MNNLKRQFVTYEQAKKLSELGFYEPCFGYYIQLKNPDEGILKIETVNNIDNNSCVYAPTYSQIFTWSCNKLKFTNNVIFLTEKLKIFY